MSMQSRSSLALGSTSPCAPALKGSRLRNSVLATKSLRLVSYD
jgi:hypothetical protein